MLTSDTLIYTILFVSILIDIAIVLGVLLVVALCELINAIMKYIAEYKGEGVMKYIRDWMNGGMEAGKGMMNKAVGWMKVQGQAMNQSVEEMINQDGNNKTPSTLFGPTIYNPSTPLIILPNHMNDDSMPILNLDIYPTTPQTPNLEYNNSTIGTPIESNIQTPLYSPSTPNPGGRSGFHFGETGTLHSTLDVGHISGKITEVKEGRRLLYGLDE